MFSNCNSLMDTCNFGAWYPLCSAAGRAYTCIWNCFKFSKKNKCHTIKQDWSIKTTNDDLYFTEIVEGSPEIVGKTH
jgi:hypothetical protein